MKFISGVPDILVNNAFKIESVQYFDEDDDMVVLKIAEYVPQFVRGYVCDMTFTFQLIGDCAEPTDASYCSHANDLVLVYIRKTVDIDSIPSFEYVFYK